MTEINFISSGMLGDFIHSLSVVKNICEKEKSMANIYLTDKINVYGGDVWRFGCSKAHHDLVEIVFSQPFVNKFEVLSDDFNEPFINLNEWRLGIENDRMDKGVYYKSWSELLSGYYNYEIPLIYKWIDIDKTDNDIMGKIMIHRSSHRHNPSFDWNKVLNMSEEFVFVTCSIDEWKNFTFKNDRIILKFVKTMNEMAICINSCKYFIGNQSAPFALASALDVPRLVELDSTACMFYINEIKYSKNISWYLREDINNLKTFFTFTKQINNQLLIKE